jgi:hypothetical protein
MPTRIEMDGLQAVKVVHEPGNMKRYEVIVISLGGDRWCAVDLLSGGSILTSRGSEIHYARILEIGSGLRGRTTRADASEIAKAIVKVVPGTTAIVCTNERGIPVPDHLFEEH